MSASDPYPFPKFGKIPRFNRDWEITEKIDGTNALVYIEPQLLGASLGGVPENVLEVVVDFVGGSARLDESGLPIYEYWIYAGSRKNWITPARDNHGFAQWVSDHAYELSLLGPGHHYGEWYGKKINRGYGLDENRFALFDRRYRYPESGKTLPSCCEVVPVVCTDNGLYLHEAIDFALGELRLFGSLAVGGYDKPEGIVLQHVQSGTRFKVLLEGDDGPKGLTHGKRF